MRLLLDESVPSRLRRTLPNHNVKTVVEMGWGGVNNGKVAVFEAALSITVRDKQREQRLYENRAALEAYNAHVERDGVFSDGLRSF